jgi:hypothetical protein
MEKKSAKSNATFGGSVRPQELSINAFSGDPYIGGVGKYRCGFGFAS